MHVRLDLSYICDHCAIVMNVTVLGLCCNLKYNGNT
jgi:hypothetical protein